MNTTETATSPQVYCVCGTPISLHHEFTDQCPDCPCKRPRAEALPVKRLL